MPVPASPAGIPAFGAGAHASKSRPRKRLASLLWAPTLVTVGVIAADAVALALYFAQR